MCLTFSISVHDHSSFLNCLCGHGGFAGADHVNGGFVTAVIAAGPAELEAEAPQEQLLHLHFEALAEHVVNYRIVHCGALGKHARQEADFRRDAATVFEDRPQTYQAVRSPAAQEAHTDQNCDLEWSRRKDLLRPFGYYWQVSVFNVIPKISSITYYLQVRMGWCQWSNYHLEVSSCSQWQTENEPISANRTAAFTIICK